jgi:hypothetical protein
MYIVWLGHPSASDVWFGHPSGDVWFGHPSASDVGERRGVVGGKLVGVVDARRSIVICFIIVRVKCSIDDLGNQQSRVVIFVPMNTRSRCRVVMGAIRFVLLSVRFGSFCYRCDSVRFVIGAIRFVLLSVRFGSICYRYFKGRNIFKPGQ